MYKLILVDDEEEVRKGMLKKINWNEHGFEVVGEAENGIEALEISEKVEPDIVVTDIKMPYMDGLELSEKLRKRYPTIKIIILTGFDEFDYARKAIKVNVADYVLKPVSSQEFIKILANVKEKMDKEIIQNEDIALLRENFFKSMPILKEKFLSDLVAGRIKKGELWEKVGKYGIKISGNSFIVSIVGINQEWKCIEDKDCDTNKLFFNDQDRELMKFAVLNISEEIIGRFGNNVAFLQNDDVVIIYSAESKDDNLMEKAGAASEEIRQSIEKYLKFSVTIGIGNECENIENISSSYRQSINALDYRVVLGNNRIICIEDLEPRSQYNLNFDELKERLLVSSIKAGNPADLKNVIQELFGEIIDGKAAYKEYQVYLLEMLTSVLKTAKNLNVDIDNIFGSNNNLFTKMYNFNDIDKAKEWFVEVCHKIMGQISQNRQDTYKLLAKQAVEYINNYYFDDEISIDKICSILHVSPTYFSMIFKKETKMTFVTYLTKVRMEAAKGLLKTTNMKTFEIAEKVGYSEPNYFSYCFKKNFGISPSEYRSGA